MWNPFRRRRIAEAIGPPELLALMEHETYVKVLGVTADDAPLPLLALIARYDLCSLCCAEALLDAANDLHAGAGEDLLRRHHAAHLRPLHTICPPGQPIPDAKGATDGYRPPFQALRDEGAPPRDRLPRINDGLGIGGGRPLDAG